MTAKTQILPGVYLTCLTTDKFKSACISLNLLSRLSNADASKNALLPRVLARGTMRYDDIQKLAVITEEYYGASVIPVVRRVGECQCFGFYAEFADDDYIPGDTNLLEQMTALLGELLLHPATKGGLLKSEYTAGEKKNLVDAIGSQVNDKTRYAIQRLIWYMCRDEDIGIDKLGTISAAESITPLALTRHYHSVLEHAPIEIIYCGAADETRVRRAVLSALSDLPRGEIDDFTPADVIVSPSRDTVQRVSEQMEISQGKLSMGFRMGPCMLQPNYAAITVFNALFGGSATSKLFENVREKLSLCYYASSAVDKIKGLLYVYSGMLPSNFDAAEAEILHQLEAIGDGDFSDKELSAAKRAVITRLNASLDSLYSLEAFYLESAISGIAISPEQLAALCDSVNSQDVMGIAQSVALDTVHYLSGREERHA